MAMAIAMLCNKTQFYVTKIQWQYRCFASANIKRYQICILSRQKSAQLLIRSPLETAATDDNRALKLKFGEHFQDGALLSQQLGVF